MFPPKGQSRKIYLFSPLHFDKMKGGATCNTRGSGYTFVTVPDGTDLLIRQG